MNEFDWKDLLVACRRVLGQGSRDPRVSDSWCAFTTFTSLKSGVHYWSCGFPEEEELLDDRTVDGGLWRQEFFYDDLAHLIVPASFYWEGFCDGVFQTGIKGQDLELLSGKLIERNLVHRKTDLVLEIKLY